MVEIGNERSNQFWEKHCQQERLEAGVERDIRESFIRAKYQDRAWIPQPTGEDREALSKQLLVCVASNNLMRTIQLLVHGADVSYEDPNEPNPKLKTCLGVARHHKQTLQVELLEQNRALSSPKPVDIPQVVTKKGHLYKTGNDRTGWKRRWCTLDQFRGVEYFRSETDPDCQGDIKIHEMLSISLCDEEKDPKYPHCFELNTQSRGYLFCADSKAEMDDWIETLKKVIPRDGAEKLGFDKVGYLRKKDPHNVGGWKKRWFTLKGKSLVYYRREREELSEIDLKKVVELKPPDHVSGTPEALCCFQICLPDRVYTLRADTPAEAESWMQALRHTQVSGIPLSEQQTTSARIPIIVHKCLQFVETFGLEAQGIYRMSGNLAKIRRLILGFNQDARGFLINSEEYTVHDVAGVLKDFFKSLPDPLLTHSLYQDFVLVMKEAEHEQQLVQLKSLVEQLPPVNRETLKRIIGHLNRVIDHESKNKMGRTNLVSLFAPTLMTVNADAVSMQNAKYEFMCMDKMIQYYKWLFEVKDEEEAKEKELEEAKEKILRAAQQQKVVNVGMTSNMKFLNTIYILSRSGDTYGTYITPETSVGEIVEEVSTNKSLPPDHYALYLVIGEGDSYRVLSSSDRLLAALSSVGSECHLCLKPNAFYESIKPFMHQDGWESVQVHVREKKKWKRYPCAVRGKSFVQFKDNKCTNEVVRLAVSELDVFAGMEKAVRTDHKNPMPTRNFFWLKQTRGMRGHEDHTKYLCTDSEQDLQKLIAALVKAKYGPEGLQTPLLPTRPPPPELAVRRTTISVSPNTPKRHQFATASVQVSLCLFFNLHVTHYLFVLCRVFSPLQYTKW
ncbi:Arf-GAP with Rho-GAP domain, ANK repeat and PH domain-containing protein 1 [Geodia barretti]|uniref:Arf-GAP with Rho-GAP domain, ANK repeat and PH domain-containing protein 1 n=1 Tax=Geodia barretti TaxID=519541 RepID=A0AA35TQ17_GEOBA|nr:Arf-GAP with Rho-GAP domain, ANK repeat and PH domain-containing protein 1 [Geodia barretti]